MNSKRKGTNNELQVAKFLRDNGIKAWRDSASGGGSGDKGDINNNLDFCIECKCGAGPSLWSSWAQVKKASSLNGNTPVLFIRRDGMSKGEHLVVMHSNDWIEHIKGDNEQEFEMDYKTRNLIQRARQGCSDLLNKLPKV